MISSYMSSMRGLTNSTCRKKPVHTVIMRALGALKEGKPRVNGSLKFKQLLLTLIGIKMQVVNKNFIRYTRINSD